MFTLGELRVQATTGPARKHPGRYDGAHAKKGSKKSARKSGRQTSGASRNEQVAIENIEFSASLKKLAIYLLKNVREQVCKKKGNGRAIAGSTAIVGVSNALVIKFGLTAAVASPIASAVLMLLYAVSKGTFCDWSDDLLKEAIRKA